MTDLTPGSAEWCKVVTASKVAAILGHSPFMSQRSVWHLMRGEYTQAETDPMRRGQYLEDGVLRWWRDQHPEFTGFVPQPSYVLDDWAAATPDAYASRYGESALVDAKTSTTDDEWGRPGTDEIPTHYLTSSFWQMHVSGYRTVYMPVLTSRLRFEEYVIHHDVEIGRLLEARCREFYDTLHDGSPPPTDDSLSTVECLSHLHAQVNKGESVEVPYDLAAAYVQAKDDADDAQQRLRGALAELYDLMGKAQYATVQGKKVARRQGSKGDGVTIHKPKGLTLGSIPNESEAA